MDALVDQLTTRLRQLRGSDVDVDDLRRLTGGASRETWSFRVGDEPMILQRQRPGGALDKRMSMEASLLRAAASAGVPVPTLFDADGGSEVMGAPYLLSAFVDGETIARRILRDDRFAAARDSLAVDCGRALAAIHAIPSADVEGIEAADQLTQYRQILRDLGTDLPTFEVALRWLEAHRPEPAAPTVVHGDFRLGNLMIDEGGLRAVVDWELAHIGDPMEDLAWLCVRAWRFGGDGPVAGVGAYHELFAAYEHASGRTVDPATVHWWEVLGTLKWGVICIMQARAHLDGLVESMELAAIGRRVCENEHDLLLLLAPEALARARDAVIGDDPPQEASIHGRPTATELLAAVQGWVVDHVRPAATGPVAFHSRVAENVLAMLGRELALEPVIAEAHAARLASLGMASESALAAAIRSGDLSLASPGVADVLAGDVVDKVRVANPRWFPADD